MTTTEWHPFPIQTHETFDRATFDVSVDQTTGKYVFDPGSLAGTWTPATEPTPQDD